ncbi:hypothetical protein AVEN_24793-1 [Araneus ventricosus]|uniref:Uncharacterized protein n=1 Tax=Araneus ventricosus TaxID=182803 RepID=A0A4Y2BWA7_ARAVE|nr:hypothetical protein AVEN_24793-1 [Araneus ventricosus]
MDVGHGPRQSGLFWYPRLGWETSLFPHVNNGKSDVSQPNRGYQNRPQNQQPVEPLVTVEQHRGQNKQIKVRIRITLPNLATTSEEDQAEGRVPAQDKMAM